VIPHQLPGSSGPSIKLFLSTSRALCLSHDSIVNEHFFLEAPPSRGAPKFSSPFFPQRDGETITLGPQRKPFLQKFFHPFSTHCPPPAPTLAHPSGEKKLRGISWHLSESHRDQQPISPNPPCQTLHRGFHPRINPQTASQKTPPHLVSLSQTSSSPHLANSSHQKATKISISPRLSIGFSLSFDGQPTGPEQLGVKGVGVKRVGEKQRAAKGQIDFTIFEIMKPKEGGWHNSGSDLLPDLLRLHWCSQERSLQKQM
jgi:hypothetical protein